MTFAYAGNLQLMWETTLTGPGTKHVPKSITEVSPEVKMSAVISWDCRMV